MFLDKHDTIKALHYCTSNIEEYKYTFLTTSNDVHVLTFNIQDSILHRYYHTAHSDWAMIYNRVIYAPRMMKIIRIGVKQSLCICVYIYKYGVPLFVSIISIILLLSSEIWSQQSQQYCI